MTELEDPFTPYPPYHIEDRWQYRDESEDPRSEVGSTDKTL